LLFLKQKALWIGAVAAFCVVVVFGLAFMGSVIGAKPKELPVALVVLDEGAALPNGEQLNLGETIRTKLLAMEGLPIAWVPAASEEEVRLGFEARRYYGALIVPANLTQGVLSLATPVPAPGEVQLLVNEGMHAQAAAAVKTALTQLAAGLRGEVSKQAFAMAGQRSGTGTLPVEAAVALMTPFAVSEEVVHPIGSNQGNGGAPGMLVQIAWIGSMAAGVALFLAGRASGRSAGERWKAVSWQTLLGILLSMAVSALIVWSAGAWYGMEMRDAVRVWSVLWLVGASFLFTIVALLRWIGLPAIGIAALLMFFSMPVLNMAPEFLPEATRNWLYDWTPLRFAADAVRTALYFDEPSADRIRFLWWLAGIALAATWGSAWKKESTRAGATAHV